MAGLPVVAIGNFDLPVFHRFEAALRVLDEIES